METTITQKIGAECTLLVLPANEQNVAAATKMAQRFLGINAQVMQNNFEGKNGDLLVLTAKNNDKTAAAAHPLRTVLLLGTTVGSTPDAKPYLLHNALKSYVFKNKKQLHNAHIGIYIAHFAPSLQPALAAGATQSVAAAYYHIAKFKTNTTHTPFTGTIATIATNQQITQKIHTATQQAQILTDVQSQVMDLVNAPANHLTPQIFAEIAQQTAQKHHFNATVWDETELKKQNFGALLAVAKGSALPPRFVILEYKPTHNPTNKTIAIIGKGVTFDTGGISIKASANMHYMKSDMAGAAAAFGAIQMAARLQIPIHIIAALPLTDNCASHTATQPGDIITSHSTQTIEIIDTDAEGRLILADALSYIIQNHAPHTVIDLATLTGACIVALGSAAAGMFTNSPKLSQKLYNAGQQTGEKLWALPLWDDYEPEIKSDIADLKNYHGKPSAGSIVAAKFLEKFTHKHPNWAHLDIAGTAFTPHEYSTMPSATAFGVALLTHFLQNEA
jgi:leucyl aminopeptidase